MTNNYFDTPAYDNLFRRVWEFEQYGNVEHYWIELDYYIARDKFTSRLGRALDTDMVSFGGESIFGTTTDKDTIADRNMLLIRETKVPQKAFQDLYKITELYGYAPNVTFEKWTAEIVSRPGIEDPSGYKKEAFTQASGFCTYDSGAATFTLNVGSTMASLFYAGDTVRISGEHRTAQQKDIVCPPVAVKEVYVATGKIIVEACGGIFADVALNISENDLYLILNRQWNSSDEFPVVRNFYLIRENTIRMPQNRKATVQNLINYSIHFPTLSDKFVVTNSTGVELDTITPQTIPTLAEWKAKISAGEYYITSESEVDDTYAPHIYKMVTKRARCR